MRSYDTVICDVDGVLIDVSRSFTAAAIDAVKSATGSDLFTGKEVLRLKGIRGFNDDWHVAVAGERVENAAFTFREGPDDGPKLDGHIAFDWGKMDAWFEEDEEVFVHARDPYKRIDVMESSRHIKVVINGEAVAETRRPRLLFETGMPIRYYIPKADVRLELLGPSDKLTRCPYKGEAHYYTIQAGNKLHEGLVWSYRHPIPECPKIAGMLCFFNEKVDIYEEGELLQRPETPWS